MNAITKTASVAVLVTLGLALGAMAAETCAADGGRYLLTLERARPDGAARTQDVGHGPTLALDVVNGAVTTPDGEAAVTLDGTKLRGKVTVADAWYELDCVVTKGVVTGKYRGEAAGTATNGAVAGTLGPFPYGHAAFVPTPERPLGFRGDGNGWFPGATPVLEFFEGTPTKTEQTIVDRSGNQKKAQVWTYADRRAKNVLWKTDVPGWSDAQPIPVKGRVFALCEPYFLVCLDAATGKILWQRELLPLIFDGVPEATARQKQDVLNIARGSGYLLSAVAGDKSKALAPKALEKLTAWKAQVAAVDPDAGLAAAFDTIIGQVESFRDGKPVKLPVWPDIGNAIVNAVERRYQVPVNYVWHGHVGYAASTPVTDGESVYVILPQGQVACYDFDGNLRWGWRLKQWERLTVHHWPSPLLCGDVLLVRNLTGDLIGVNRKTGERLWETEIGQGGNHGSYLSHKLMRVPLPDGMPLDVVVTNKRKILRVSDGKILGEFAFERWNNGHGPGLIGRGDMFFAAQTYDAPSSPLHAYRLKAESADAVTAELVYKLPEQGPGAMGGGSITLSDPYLTVHGPIWDAATGKQLWNGGIGEHDAIRIGGLGGAGAAIIGHYNIYPKGSSDWGRELADASVANPCLVLDVANPMAARLVSEENLLGDTALPRDIVADQYLPEFDKRLFVGCYRGIAGWFGGRLGGIMPHGDRMYLQSAMALYCIGPAVNGTPADDPTVVAAIRAAAGADAVAGHLTAESAQYRYEAVKALARLKAAGGQAEALKKIALGDPYEEIRAEAVKALDATDPDGLPGWNPLLARYLAVATATPWRNWLWQPERSERGRIERTFAALARVAVPRLRAALATAETAPEKDALTRALAACGVPTP